METVERHAAATPPVRDAVTPERREPAPRVTPTTTPAAPRFFAPPPLAAWLVALLAAVLHIAPFWHAQLSARGEWTFTENLTISPDQMQYRIWQRQSQREGPVITNRFTTEPNRKYLPVYFHWAVGKVAGAVGTTPERAYAYAGCLLAFLLTLLVFCTTRWFLPGARATWWTFLAMMFGGGFGGHLRVLSEVPLLKHSGAWSRLVIEPMQRYPVFEQYRGHYLLVTLLDTQALLTWLVGMASVVALYFAVRRATIGRVALAAALFAAITVLHVYEGVTLLAIAAGVLLCVWRTPLRRPAMTALAACTVAVGVCYAVLGAVYRRSGLPFPEWHAIDILFSTLVLAFPLSWALIAWGGRRYWLSAGDDERFLVGWALGCTVVTLAGPYYPYPDRGTLTMQVPLFLIAGGIFFARWARVSARQAALAVALFGGAPLWLAARTWHFSGFRTDAPFQFATASQRRALAALRQRADTGDVLLAEPSPLLWLAPEFPGRLYVGHFFLTVDYDAKASALREAIDDPAKMPALLERSGATLLFVGGDRSPERLASVPGLAPVAREQVGWLFERTAGAAARGGR